ncbi:MAG: hypothetical protein PUI63_09460 [Alistipes senegalensis]|uniref:hypothetical protein n=1 Tax=Alistipes senegalensis TaxID=1288121 RepID=UPI00242C9079|nr:hypothetical protein [Alistipes senegalensis]MDD7039453.1 hypothetical protein [Alistipes senegalensis]
MEKSKIKQIINRHFGFQQSKIDLLEYSTTISGNSIDYVMFEVCGVEYQMNFDYSKGYFVLKVYDGHGHVEA